MRRTLICLIGMITVISTGSKGSIKYNTDMKMKGETLKNAVFAGGCFWCTEAIFSQLKGVEKAVSGYSGGKTVNPTYIFRSIPTHFRIETFQFQTES